MNDVDADHKVCQRRGRKNLRTSSTHEAGLARRGHGIWYYRPELPADADGNRRPRRRGGFTSQATRRPNPTSPTARWPSPPPTTSTPSRSSAT